MPSGSPINNFRIAGETAAQKGPIASLTDSSGGTASDTLVESVGANPTAAEFENNMASLAAKVNAILVVLRHQGIIVE